MAIQTGDNKWSVTNYQVDPTAGKGDFTTISDACAFFLANAITGVTCSIKSGTYTEDVASVAPGITYTALGGSCLTPSVTIVGKLTMTETGTATFFGCALRNSSDYGLVVSGSNNITLFLDNCLIIANDNTFLSYTNTGASSTVFFKYSRGITQNSGVAYFEASQTNNLVFNFCDFVNVLSTTANTISSGALILNYSQFDLPITSSATSSIAIRNVIGVNIGNVTYLTIGGSGTNRVSNCSYDSGSASAISVGSSATVAECVLTSSNTNAITGAGTVSIGENTFPSSMGINTSVVTPLNSRTGYLRSSNLGVGVAPGTTAGITFDATSYLNNYVATTAWVPSLLFGGGSTGMTFSTQSGTYVRIGTVVYFTIYLQLTAKGSSTGSASLANFPITSAQPSTNFPSITAASYTGVPFYFMNNGATSGSLFANNGGTNAAMTHANFNDTTGLRMTGFYFV